MSSETVSNSLRTDLIPAGVDTEAELKNDIIPDDRYMIDHHTGEVLGEANAPSVVQTENEARISNLFQSHYKDLVRITSLILGSTEEAEDVVTGVFAAVWENGINPNNPLGYLRTASLYRARSVFRHRAVVDRHGNIDDRVEPSAELGAMRRFEQEEVVLAIKKLPRKQREAVVLRYYAELKPIEIAAQMGISLGTLKSHLHRALAKLAIDMQRGTASR